MAFRPRYIADLLCLCASIWIVALLAGCSDRAKPPVATAPPPARIVSTVPDYVASPQIADGETSTGPRRIVSTSPQLTEIACALGLRDSLVGRSSYCSHPPGIDQVPNVGGLLDLNLELLVQLKPDLVLISGRSELIRTRLTDLRIDFVSLPDSSLNDIYLAIEELGKLTHRNKTAARLNEAIRSDLQRLADEYAAQQPYNVLLLTARLIDPPRSPYVAGPGSYLSSLLEMLGHRNAASRLARPYGQLSLEEILTVNPDVIIEFRAPDPADPEACAEAYRTWAKLGPLQAVTNQRLRLVAEQMHLVPGPRVAMTLRELIRNIPE